MIKWLKRLFNRKVKIPMSIINGCMGRNNEGIPVFNELTSNASSLSQVIHRPIQLIHEALYSKILLLQELTPNKKIQLILTEETLKGLIEYDEDSFDNKSYDKDNLDYSKLRFVGVQIYIGQSNKIQVIDREIYL